MNLFRISTFKMPALGSFLLAALLIPCFSDQVFSEEPKQIQDNSFLIEEAYNQERGVVQHIQGFQYMKNKTWGYTFTQEWPVLSENHQLSYTIPVSRVDESEMNTGLGDILVNYRYQVLMKGPVAIAPRLSVIFPTGDYKKGLGSDAYGVQGNLPLSLELSHLIVTHWNAGITYIPNSKGADGSKFDARTYNYGGSIILLISENFNMMFEAVGTSLEKKDSHGVKEKEHTFFINPGMRFAINFESGLQIVPGISAPIGLGPSRGDYGVFVYLSFEHPFMKL